MYKNSKLFFQEVRIAFRSRKDRRNSIDCNIREYTKDNLKIVKYLRKSIEFNLISGIKITLEFVAAGLGFLCGMCLALRNAMPFEIPKMSNAYQHYEKYYELYDENSFRKFNGNFTLAIDIKILSASNITRLFVCLLHSSNTYEMELEHRRMVNPNKNKKNVKNMTHRFEVLV